MHVVSPCCGWNVFAKNAGRLAGHAPRTRTHRCRCGRCVLLAKAAATVSVADVIRAVDGPLVSVYGLRPEAVTYNERADALQRVWIAARHSLRDVFEQVSVADLASGKLPNAVARLTEDEDAWQPH